MSVLLVSLLFPLVTQPDSADVLGPLWFREAVSYYASYEGAADQPLVNGAGLATDLSVRRGEGAADLGPIVVDDGLLGRCLHIRDWRAPLVLRGEAVSPHRALTVSFWWALPYDLAIDGGYQLFDITGAGLVSLFCRGKGEWCALQKPAGVFQVYYFTGIQNINGIYDFDLLSHVDLRAQVWHHTAVVFRRASAIEGYVDGSLAFEYTITGREFTADDDLTTLTVGGPLYVDELAVLGGAPEGDMIADYYRGVSRLREYLTR